MERKWYRTQLAARYGLHTTQINSWERQLIAQAAEVFSKDQGADHPPTNGICKCFHKTRLQEFYQVAFGRRIYQSIEQSRADLHDVLQQWAHSDANIN